MRSILTKTRANPSESQWLGYAFGLIAGISYGAWSVIAKTAIGDYDIPPLLFATVAFLFGTIMFAPLLAYDGPRAFRDSKRALAWFALSGIGSGAAIIALSFGLEKGDVTVVAPIVSISPLITLVLVRIFLEKMESISPTLVFGALLIVGGTVLVVVGDSVF